MSVGVALVSHSFDLVSGLRSILRQIQPDIHVGIAGGTEDNGIGTNAFKIKAAIEASDAGSGVVILFDLGSALINAELAVEMLEKDIKVNFCDAPLVEGAYTAVIEAGCGSSIEEVTRAAESVKQIPKLR